MVARLPTEQEVVGSSPTLGSGSLVSFEARLAQSVEHKTLNLGVAGSTPALGFFLFRYGVVGNMSGFHPVASGSIPGIGFEGEVAKWSNAFG